MAETDEDESMLPLMIVVDVWGGDDSSDHVARFHCDWDRAAVVAKRELHAGFLVNLRAETAWGPDQDFDNRSVN